MTLDKILAHFYQSDETFDLSYLADSGWTVRVGDNEEATFDTLREVKQYLLDLLSD